MLAVVREPFGVLFVALAGLGAGFINGVAGGGTLVSFPVLLALGVPAIRANVTSTVGIWPGYLGGAAGFRRQIGDQVGRLKQLAPSALAGAVVGSVLLLVTPANSFKSISPYLILVSCGLFAAQPYLAERLARTGTRSLALLAHGGTFVACTYGAYFGAGLGVLLLAVLGIALPDSLERTSALRSILSLAVNVIAALVYSIAAHVEWVDAGVLALFCLAGGYVGALFSLRVPRTPLRILIILIGLAAAATLLAR